MTVWAVLRGTEIDGVATTTLVGVFSSGAKAERYARRVGDAKTWFVVDDHVVDDLDEGRE